MILVAKKTGNDSTSKRNGTDAGAKSGFMRCINGDIIHMTATSGKPSNINTPIYFFMFVFWILLFFWSTRSFGYNALDKNSGSAIRKSKNLYARSYKATSVDERSIDNKKISMRK